MTKITTTRIVSASLPTIRRAPLVHARLWLNKGKWVGEDIASVLKAHTVLPLVAQVFGAVPFEGRVVSIILYVQRFTVGESLGTVCPARTVKLRILSSVDTDE